MRCLKLLVHLGLLTPALCHSQENNMLRLVHWSKEEDEKNLDQSQVTPVTPAKTTLDQPIASEHLDMEVISAKISQAQPRSDEPHRHRN